MDVSTVTRDRPESVGGLLRTWRVARGMSQMDLALHAGFSARHVSFIETGRAQPSRQALLVLAEALEVPLRERNRLLEAGGYAHVYRQTPLAADEMAHVRSVLQFILERHDPYGAVVLDRYSNCVMANGASAGLIRTMVDASILTEPINLVRITFHPLGLRRCIVNWNEVAPHLMARAERELGALRDDGTAAALLAELRRHAAPATPERRAGGLRPADLLLPVHLSKGDVDLRLFSTIMTLGTPQDVTLQELRIETFFPADEASERTWRRLTSSESCGRTSEA